MAKKRKTIELDLKFRATVTFDNTEDVFDIVTKDTEWIGECRGSKGYVHNMTLMRFSGVSECETVHDKYGRTATTIKPGVFLEPKPNAKKVRNTSRSRS